MGTVTDIIKDLRDFMRYFLKLRQIRFTGVGIEKKARPSPLQSLYLF